MTAIADRSGANAVERFVLAPEQALPDSTLVIDADTGREWSRGEIADGIRRAAAVLVDLGVTPEQRVALVLSDTPTFLFFFWGAMWIGAVPVPISTMLNADDYRFLLDDSRAVGLVLSDSFLTTAGTAAQERPFLRFVLVDGDAALAESTRVSDVLARAATIPALFPATDDDIAFWLYTSGTTGFPKGAQHRHADLGACVDLYASGILGMGPDDRVYSVAKLFFAYGLGNAGYFPPACGASAVLNAQRPDPVSVSAHVLAHRPTLFFGVPTFYAALLNADVPDNTFDSVRLGVSAGESLPAELHRRFRDRFGVEILDGIGTTEALHIFLSNRPGESIAGTSGTPVPGYEVELRGPDGASVADGEPGHLHVAGESVMVGYRNRTDLNRTVLQGRFIATGDQYQRRVEDGHFEHLGRSDDMLKVSGIWVSPSEVEACILEIDEVMQVAVVGAESEDGLVKPRAFVVPTGNASADDLPERVQAHVREQLAPFKYPRWVDIVEELPMTATGKVKRYLLRERPLPGT